jgi:uncharacterized protein YjbI with pentapeptide repeats
LSEVPPQSLGQGTAGSRIFNAAALFAADLQLANHEGADFSRVHRCCLNFRSARLTKAVLACADLGTANLEGADLSHSKLRGARFNRRH